MLIYSLLVSGLVPNCYSVVNNFQFVVYLDLFCGKSDIYDTKSRPFSGNLVHLKLTVNGRFQVDVKNALLFKLRAYICIKLKNMDDYSDIKISFWSN